MLGEETAISEMGCNGLVLRCEKPKSPMSQLGHDLPPALQKRKKMGVAPNPPASPTSKNSNPPSLRETSRTSSGEPDFQPVLRHDPLRTSWHTLIQGKAIE
jgi:hypothetical protein